MEDFTWWLLHLNSNRWAREQVRSLSIGCSIHGSYTWPDHSWTCLSWLGIVLPLQLGKSLLLHSFLRVDLIGFDRKGLHFLNRMELSLQLGFQSPWALVWFDTFVLLGSRQSLLFELVNCWRVGRLWITLIYKIVLLIKIFLRWLSLRRGHHRWSLRTQANLLQIRPIWLHWVRLDRISKWNPFSLVWRSWQPGEPRIAHLSDHLSLLINVNRNFFSYCIYSVGRYPRWRLLVGQRIVTWTGSCFFLLLFLNDLGHLLAFDKLFDHPVEWLTALYHLSK